jgi:crotonobetainyl-CoA:carnitine CoA-transferase CaiB-like acyl-CoA transferase
MDTTTDTGPLEGVRVVELATVVMGPLATQLLADLGAEVVKVEGLELDRSRSIGGGGHPELSGVSVNLHRNKRSIQLDLKAPEGREAMGRLLMTADLFVTNLRPRSLASLGLDHETLKSSMPRLIHCAAQGYRHGSGEENRPAYDDVIQAETGLADLSAKAGDSARYIPTLVADKVSALMLVQAAVAALWQRDVRGHAARVELSMFDAVLAFQLVEHLAAATFPGGEAGYGRILNAKRGPHRTQDGLVSVLPYSDRDWHELFAEVGREAELLHFPFTSERERHENADTVYSALASVLEMRTTREWMSFCASRGIPAGQVVGIDEIVSDPALHRGVLIDDDHPVVGPYRRIASPLRFDGAAPAIRGHAPVVGEHTTEVLHELGYSELQIEALVRRGTERRAAAARLASGGR